MTTIIKTQKIKKISFVDLVLLWFKKEILKYPQIWLHEKFFWLWLKQENPKLIKVYQETEFCNNFLKLKVDYWNATRHPRLFAKLEFEKEIFKLKNQDLFNQVKQENQVTIKLLPKHKNKHT